MFDRHHSNPIKTLTIINIKGRDLNEYAGELYLYSKYQVIIVAIIAVTIITRRS